MQLEGASLGDLLYRGGITACALCVPLLLGLLAIEIAAAAAPALRAFGTSFLTSRDWDPVRDVFGVAPAIFGTIATSVIALVVATPLALGVAIFLSEFAPGALRRPLAFMVDLLAAIPSVVYGLWGIFVLVPFVRVHLGPFLTQALGLGRFAPFGGVNYGFNLLSGGLILAIMVLPYISAVAREVLLAVPRSQREAALALGATRWEMITGAVLPYARSGIIGGVILGLGRALGETMAITMVIGNSLRIPSSLFAPSTTLAAQIANQFSEATSDLQLSALMAAGLVLFVITLVANILARWLVWRVTREPRP
jgi:phosphate transport system permease protein